MDKLLTKILEKKRLRLLSIDNMILGFDQDIVLSIENISEITTKRQSKKSSGSIKYKSIEIPVYAFNKDLSLVDHPSKNNRFCVSLKHPDNKKLFSIMCDAVEQYDIDDDNKINAIPALSYHPESPVIGLLKKDSNLVLLSCAESMRDYINTQEQRYA